MHSASRPAITRVVSRRRGRLYISAAPMRGMGYASNMFSLCTCAKSDGMLAYGAHRLALHVIDSCYDKMGSRYNWGLASTSILKSTLG